jgi:hypothetical protein
MFTVAFYANEHRGSLFPGEHVVYRSRYHRYSTPWRGTGTRPRRLQLVFDTRELDGTPLEKLDNVMGSKAAQAIIKSYLWFTQYTSYVAVTAEPLLLVSCSDLSARFRGYGIGFMSGNRKKHIWSYKDLARRCFFLDSVTSNCHDCPVYSRCPLEMIHTDPAYGFLPESYDKSDAKTWLDACDDPDQLFNLLYNNSQWGEWQFVPPMQVSRDFFSERVPPMEQIDFSVHEEMKAARAERSQTAAQTRKAYKLAKDGCALFGGCSYAPHYAGRWCRRCSIVTKDTVAERIRILVSGVSQEERDQISFVVHNSGESTGLLGPTLSLSRINLPGRHVVSFTSRRNKHDRDLSFHDAYQVMTTPYRKNGKYVYPNISRGIPLTDEQIAIYMMLSGHKYLDYFRTRGWGFSDEIVFITPGRPSGIHVQTSMGYRFDIMTFAHLCRYYSVDTVLGRL